MRPCYSPLGIDLDGIHKGQASTWLEGILLYGCGPFNALTYDCGALHKSWPPMLPLWELGEFLLNPLGPRNPLLLPSLSRTPDGH